MKRQFGFNILSYLIFIQIFLSCDRSPEVFQTLSDAKVIIPINKQLGVLEDTLSLVLSSDSNSGVTFRFIHPTYQTAFWNAEHFIQFLIHEYELSPKSSDLEIISAISEFTKMSGLQGNYSIVQQADPRTTGIMTIVDHQSLNCANHGDRVLNISAALTTHLKRSPIEGRRVVLKGHQAIEYFDKELQKWVFIDPDPIASILLPRQQGQLVSFDEIKKVPEILLDSTTIEWLSDTLKSEVDARKRYYDYIVPKFHTAIYQKHLFIEDNREVIYRLPKGAKMTLPVVLDTLVYNWDFIHPDTLKICYEGFLEKDTSVIKECLKISNLEKYFTPSSIFDHISNQKLKPGSQTFMKRVFNDSSHFVVNIPPGNYSKAAFYIPHLLRSVELSNPDASILLNEQNFDHNTFIQYYWPVNTELPEYNDYINIDEIIYGVNSLAIPPEAGMVKLTFYYNQQLLEFWKGALKVAVFDGNLDWRYDIPELNM